MNNTSIAFNLIIFRKSPNAHSGGQLQTALLNTEELHLKVQLICSEPTLKPKSTLGGFDQLITFLLALFDRTYHVMMRALHPDMKSFILLAVQRPRGTVI